MRRQYPRWPCPFGGAQVALVEGHAAELSAYGETLELTELPYRGGRARPAFAKVLWSREEEYGGAVIVLAGEEVVDEIDGGRHERVLAGNLVPFFWLQSWDAPGPGS